MDIENRVIHSAIPGVTESKMFFEVFTFDPEDSIPKSVLLEILRSLKWRIGPESFYELSPEAQKQFIRLDRTGVSERVKPHVRPPRK